MPRVKSVPNKQTVITIDDETEECITNRSRKRVKKSQKNYFDTYEYAVDQHFQKYLSEANFYLTINFENSGDQEWRECRIGSLRLTADAIAELDAHALNNGQLYVYCKRGDPCETVLYYERVRDKVGAHRSARLVSGEERAIDYDLLESLTASHVFRLTANVLNARDDELVVDVCVLKSALAHYYSAHRINERVLTVMNHFYSFGMPSAEPNNELWAENFDLLYTKIREKHNAMNSSLESRDVQHPSLYPHLRRYQIDAVRWMLHRERLKCLSDHQILVKKLVTVDGHELFYNQYVGSFIDGKSLPLDYSDGTSLSGILADEMGLGKTIEVLACILCHPKSFDDLNMSEIEAKFRHNIKGCFECVCGEISNINEFKLYSYQNNNSMNDSVFNEETDEQTDEELSTSDTIETSFDDSSDQINDNNHSKLSDRSVNGKRKPRKQRTRRNKRKKNSDVVIVQCGRCGSHQHAHCVNFNTERRRPYFCGHCWVSADMKRVNSRATLIVSPTTICYQWQEEITKHVDCTDMNIFVYEGVHKGYVQPLDLADNDIVLTTYETLRSELNYIDLHHSNSFRRPKRFNATPTPLMAVNWWRICLDEAQMVEGASTHVARMALKLHASHRWCITGTPIQRSVNDLFGLFMFVGEEPFCQRLYWDVMLYHPYCNGIIDPMVTALSHCFWRTSKNDVWSQLGIPEQTLSMRCLKFSPVEQHFYMRQHNECQLKFNEKMLTFTDLNIRLKELDKHTANVLLKPMLSLRQACCHPQAIRGKFIPISKKTLSMEELLKTMIKNTQYEAEEEHRKLISALNGIAAIYIIEEDYKQAVDMYRKALASIRSYKEKDLFRTDKLQQLHTLHNLAEILELCGVQQIDRNTSNNNLKTNTCSTTKITIITDLTRTLDDEFMRYDGKQLSDEYLAKGRADVDECFEQLKTSMAESTEIEEKFELSEPWWKLAIDHLSQTNDDEFYLIDKVKETLEQTSNSNLVGPSGSKFNVLSSFSSIASKFSHASGFIYILDKNLLELTKARHSIKKSVTKLKPLPSEEELNQSVDCHLRPEKDEKGFRAAHVLKCKYCLIHESFNEYESKLYYFSDQEKIEESRCKSDALFEKLRRGTWGDSETEQSLKIVHQTFKNKFHNSSDVEFRKIISDGANHIKFFDSLKREFRALRAVWMEIFDFISKIDELNMATIRLRLRFDNEPKPKEPVPYILESSDVKTQLFKNECDEKVATSLLNKKLSHLYYLNNLSNAESGRTGGQNLELCPICQLQLGQQWSVLPCGHCLCVKCIDIMISGYSIHASNETFIRCALCRCLGALQDILYVNSMATEEDVDPVQVLGSWSTKVEEVVRCLLKIIREDPTAKSIIFSTWTDVLQLISNALLENSIEHCFIKHSYRFAARIDSFKHNNNIKVLLLPINSGSKGLNLIEATHVILVEPTLNKANELQAVGRVHRIGQTKATFVHRFIVRDTIEERINSLYSGEQQTDHDSSLSPQMANTQEHAYITLKEMKKLFCGSF